MNGFLTGGEFAGSWAFVRGHRQGGGVALERVAWTDERIDDSFRLLRDEMREMRTEMREMRVELRTEMREMRVELQGQISAGQRQMTVIGWGIAGALLAQLIAFIITQS